MQRALHLPEDAKAAITALKTMPWFPGSVRDIRAFRVEQWSDFTPTVKG
jgi:virulence-associated protein VapD